MAIDAEDNSIEATRRRLPAVPVRYVGLVGGLGGGVEMRQVLARFPAMIAIEKTSKSYSCRFKTDNNQQHH